MVITENLDLWSWYLNMNTFSITRHESHNLLHTSKAINLHCLMSSKSKHLELSKSPEDRTKKHKFVKNVILFLVSAAVLLPPHTIIFNWSPILPEQDIEITIDDDAQPEDIQTGILILAAILPLGQLKFVRSRFFQDVSDNILALAPSVHFCFSPSSPRNGRLDGGIVQS